MSKATTVDQLPIESHVRWAQDQIRLDLAPFLTTEAQTVAQHPEMMGASAIYPSQLEELVGVSLLSPWANFLPPATYYTTAKRLFSHKVVPSIDLGDESSIEEQESDGEENNALASSKLAKLVLSVEKFSRQPSSLFEKDKTCIFDLLQTLRELNQWLRHINGCNLRYKKG